jgi:hypothetical protein
MTRSGIFWTGILLSSVAYSGLALAADADMGRKPAVSGVNGKIEFEGGPYSLDTFGGGMEWNGGASLSVPLSDFLGMQADIAASNTVNGNTLAGGVLHLFTRDPDSYLFGAAGGAFWTNNANAQLIGPEIELYSGPISFQAYGGLMNASVAGVGSTKFFGIADVDFYATENLMLQAGVKDVMDFKTAHLGLEYQFSDTMPLSFTLDGKIGDNNYRSVDAGLKFYFGGTSKSLQRRHREDDPPNRIFDVFSGAGTAFTPPGTTVDPETACLAKGWNWSGSTCYDPEQG